MRDVPTKISLDWSKVYGCHWCWQHFCQPDNAISQYTLAFALASATCQHELERLHNESCK